MILENLINADFADLVHNSSMTIDKYINGKVYLYNVTAENLEALKELSKECDNFKIDHIVSDVLDKDVTILY